MCAFLAEYRDGAADLNDATLGERLEVFTSILPLGFVFHELRRLAETEHAPMSAPTRSSV